MSGTLLTYSSRANVFQLHRVVTGETLQYRTDVLPPPRLFFSQQDMASVGRFV
jgi:hypothetical protein